MKHGTVMASESVSMADARHEADVTVTREAQSLGLWRVQAEHEMNQKPMRQQ